MDQEEDVAQEETPPVKKQNILSPKVGIVILVAVLFLMIASFMNFVNFFYEIPVSVTNIAFAVQMAIASVCFSWKRAIPEGEISNQNDLRKVGENAFGGAIMFALASIFRYTAQLLEKLFVDPNSADLNFVEMLVFVLFHVVALSFLILSLSYVIKMFAHIGLLLFRLEEMEIKDREAKRVSE